MDIICIDDIKTLLKREGGAYVSIFLPTHHTGADPQDLIRLKNLVRRAEEKLVESGVRSAEARVLLEPVQRLIQDNLFWRQQSDGLAIFLRSNLYMYYQVPVILDELVVISDRFDIKPLIPLLSDCGWFYVLALSQNETRLLQCTRHSSIRVHLEGVPKNLAEAIQYETPDARMSYHSATNIGGTRGEYYIGPSSNYNEKNILHFFAQVNKGVQKILKEEKAPLVMAGVESILPIYRKANSYNNILPTGILGNPDGWSDDTLREQAWKIVQPYFDKSKREAMAQFNESAGTGLTSTDMKEVIQASYTGRIRFLFVAKGVQQWGTINTVSNEINLHPNAQSGDEDLLDFAAFEALAHAGTVFILNREEVPGNTILSAVLRY